jgi:signal transduction histidine kinase
VFRRVRLDPVLFDLILAVVFTAIAEVEVWLTTEVPHHRAAGALLAPIFTASIAVRRRYPTIVGCAIVIVGAAAQAYGVSPQTVSVPVGFFCALYGLTAWTPPRRFAFGLAVVVAADLGSVAGPHPTFKSTVPFTVVSAVVMLLVRFVLGDLQRRAQLAERERDLVAREAVVEERARIARELHDAIAHNVSMMVVQAGAERRVLEAESGSTHEVLETIEKIGRGALTEMRRLVGMLRSDSADPLAPQPSLGDLPTLVSQVREAGLSAELQVEGEHRPLPVGIELSAYRIVQEALTNALKHAGNAHAVVHVRYGDDSLELEILDDGPGAAAPVATGGHGLVGMRERVALYGGTLHAGRRPTGGFAIRVLLPTR